MYDILGNLGNTSTNFDNVSTQVKNSHSNRQDNGAEDSMVNEENNLHNNEGLSESTNAESTSASQTRGKNKRSTPSSNNP